jgi:hypothetical protein
VGTGGVTINVTANQTAPAGGYLLGSATLNASTSATQQITINGNNNTITSFTGTSTTLDGVFSIAGTDFVTIDGLNIAEAAGNATPTTQMEWGYGLFKLNNAAPFDGTQNVTIRNCTITLNRANTASKCIYGINRIATSATNLTLVTAADANSNNKFYNNTLQNAYNGIYLQGSSVAAAYDLNNDIGGTSAATGNIVQNMGGSTTILYCIYTAFQNNANVSYNTINNTAGGGVANTAASYGIYMGQSVNGNYDIKNNSITLAHTSGATYMIMDVSTGTGTSNIDNNTLSGTITSTSVFYGICIGDPVSLFIGGKLNMNITNNKFSDLTLSTTSTSYLIYHYSSPATTNITESGNAITGTSAPYLKKIGTSGTLYYRYNFSTSSAGTYTCFNNVLRDVAMSGSSTFIGIDERNGGTGQNKRVFNNAVYNVTTTTGGFTGIIVGYAATDSVYNNEVYNITAGGTTVGIQLTTSNVNAWAYNNRVYNITNTSTSATTGMLISSGTTLQMFRNNIYNLKNTSTGTVTGIGVTGGTTTAVYNNFISDLGAPSGTSNGLAVVGISATSSTSGIYYNTVVLGTTATPLTGGTNFGVTGIYFGTNTVDVRNNIVNVNATANGTGSVAALRRSALGTINTKPANFTGNSNIYYVNPAAQNYIYVEALGTTSLRNGYAVSGVTASVANNIVNDAAFNTGCSLYKGFMGSSNEGGSFVENNLVAGATTGTFAPTGNSFAESSASPVTALTINDDFSGASRGANPDRGALQFTGTSTDATAPTITLTTIPVLQYCTTAPTLTTTITDASGVNTTTNKPRLYYKKSTEANAFGTYPADNASTFNGWKYVEPDASSTGSTFNFTFNYTLLNSAIAVGDSITYFVVAQDNVLPNPNVGTTTAAYASGYCPASVNLLPAAGPLLASPASNGFLIRNVNTLTTVVSKSTLCVSEAIDVTLSPVPAGVNIQWQRDNGTGTYVNFAGGTTIPYTTPNITNADNIRAQISCGSTPVGTTIPAAVNVLKPQLLTTTPATRCGTGTLTLSATAAPGNIINWYDAATGGNYLGTGTSFSTPTISSTRQYFAAAALISEATGGGRVTPQSSSNGLSSGTDYGITIDAYQPFTIVSADVYNTSTAGSLTVQLVNSAGTVLQTAGPISVPAGTGTTLAAGATPYTVTLNFNVPVGTGYRLRTSPTGTPPTMIRDNPISGYTFPQPIGVVGAVSGGWLGGSASTNTYYFFYNLKYTTSCEAPRTSVAANITTPPAVTIANPTPGICTGASATLTANSTNNGYSYVWSTTATTNSVSVSPASSTKYWVTATDNTSGPNAGCVTTDTANITVSGQPLAPIIAPANATICAGASSQLTVTTDAKGAGVVGTGTATNGATGYPAPIAHWWGASRHQMIYTAAELTALGMKAGYNIDTITFNIINLNSIDLLKDFTINIGHTAAASFASTTAWATGLTNVYSVASYTPVLGNNTFKFFTPFAWNGNDNVVVEVMSNNADGGVGSGHASIEYSTVGANSTMYYRADNLAAGIPALLSASATATSRIADRTNIKFGYSNPYTLKWSSVTGLFKDAALTTAMGANDTNSVVYASPAANASYTTTVTLNGCTSPASAAAAITVNALPTATITPAGSTAICAGSSVTLNANTGTGLTYQWKKDGVDITPGGTGSSYSATAAGSYTVVVKNANNCTRTSAATVVTVNPLPTATATPATTTTFCQGGSVLINANTGAGLTYQWQKDGADITTGGTGASYTANTTGSYTVIVKDGNNCTQTSNATAVTVNALPTATITPATTTTFCQGGSVVLNANTGTGLTYQWKRNGTDITPGGTSADYTATTSGSYTVEVKNANNCVNTSTATVVTVNPLPTATATPVGATTFCQGSSVLINANTGTGLTYQWRINGSDITPGGTSSSYTATANGNYSVVVRDVNNCAATSTNVPVTVVVPIATATAAGNTTLCAGSNVILNANTGSGLTYQWKKDGADITPGGTNSSYTASAAGSYTVTVTNSINCVATSTPVVVSVITPTATITPASTTTFCQGGSVVLNANTGTGLDYQWKKDGVNITPGGNASSYTATTSGSYTVEVSVTGSSCSIVSSPVAVTVNSLPTATAIAGGPTSFCQGGSVALSANSGAGLTYQWKLNGVNIPTGGTSITYNANATGSYTVEVRNANSCVNTSNAVAVTANPLPTATISPASSTTICQGNTVTLNANTGTGLTYQWKRGGVDITPGGNSSSYDASVAGNYTVQVRDANNCSSTSSITPVTVNSLPTATITAAGPTTFCQGGSVTLNANTGAGLSYQWKRDGINITPGGTGNSYSATIAGSYTVEVRNSNNCTNLSSGTVVTVNALPTATITPAGSTTICQGNTVTLSANTGTGLTYQWKRNGTDITPGGTGSFYAAGLAGNYTVEVTNSNGCKATSAARAVTVLTPTASVTPAGPFTFCDGGNVLLSANTGTGLTYQWKRNGANITGETNSTYSATTSGNYTVEVTLNALCPATSTGVSVTVNPLPPASAIPGSATTFCLGDSVTIQANTGAGLSYQWKRNGTDIIGANSTSYKARTSGSYTVVVTDGNSCNQVSPAIDVTANPIPSAIISILVGKDSFCDGASVTFDATNNLAQSYRWQRNGTDITGATLGTLSTNTAGTYRVIVTGTGSCADTSDNREVVVHPTPVPVITKDLITMTTPNIYTSYQWYLNGNKINGATDTMYVAQENGNYTLQVTNDKGCSGVSTIELIDKVNVENPANVAKAVRLYPNPTKGMVYIDAPAAVKVIVTTLDGKILHQQEGVAPINITDYADGMYMIRVTDKNDRLLKVERMVKSDL